MTEMGEEKVFMAEVKCGYSEWWRYNVFMTAACFDADGKISDYLALTDKVWEPGDGTEIREAPEGYDPARTLMLKTPLCDHAEVHVYVIANTFPVSTIIKESPPFEIELITSSDGGKPETTICKVNQWGGISLNQKLK